LTPPLPEQIVRALAQQLIPFSVISLSGAVFVTPPSDGQ
jgi:hypothetical protein